MTCSLQRTWLSVASALTVLVSGCGGGSVSKELVDAHRVVNQARVGLASRLEPERLREAAQLLAEAEAASDGSERQRQLAYLADRRARMAIAEAQATHVRRAVSAAEDQHRRALESTALTEAQRLRHVQEDLERIRRDALRDRALAAREEAIAQREAELFTEREGRLEAERHAADAMARLAEMAPVRVVREETVITLRGEALFETDRARIRPAARRRLAAVANALRAQPGRRVRVEGRGDARGRDDDLELSRRRARAVREVLIEEGVAPSRIEAIGRREDDALDRRVEIILEPASPNAARASSSEPPGRTPAAMEEEALEGRTS